MAPAQLALVTLAGFGAGALNALAGGGTLLSFPALVAAGLPGLIANATSTIALCPGYLGAALAQRTDLQGQRARIGLLLPAAALGGALGAILLLHTSEKRFTQVVPWLLLGACALLGWQERVRTALALRQARRVVASPPGLASAASRPRWPRRHGLPLVIGLAAVYGGYFGAGMSVVLLAGLGLACTDSLPRLNALKQLLALAANFTAAAWLALYAEVDWTVIAIVGVSALAGGACGGRLARRLSARWLRRVVVSLGLAVALLLPAALALAYCRRPRGGSIMGAPWSVWPTRPFAPPSVTVAWRGMMRAWLPCSCRNAARPPLLRTCVADFPARADGWQRGRCARRARPSSSCWPVAAKPCQRFASTCRAAAPFTGRSTSSRAPSGPARR